jgi:multidrug efflux pump subunit AcrA (membrane-fusion protein)
VMPMNRSSSRSLLACAALSAAVLLSATGCDTRSPAQASPVPAPVTRAAAAPPPSAPVPVDISDARPFTTTGPLVAEQQADVAAERDGLIAHVGVQIGDHVRKGSSSLPSTTARFTPLATRKKPGCSRSRRRSASGSRSSKP